MLLLLNVDWNSLLSGLVGAVVGGVMPRSLQCGWRQEAPKSI
jgi:hypothetical protein